MKKKMRKYGPGGAAVKAAVSLAQKARNAKIFGPAIGMMDDIVKASKESMETATKGGYNRIPKSAQKTSAAEKAYNKRTSDYQKAVDDSYKKKGGTAKKKKK